MRIVRGLRKGWLKPKPKQRPTDETEFFDIWKNSEATAPGRKALVHIAAPKVPLPGHAESYNPPAEYLLTPDETKEWEEMDPEDRPRDFLPKKYSSLRLVPAYPRFLQERFSRCLDLYLCPRTIKHRIHVDPESLIPKLPKPDDLRPFPTKQSVEYRGHSDRVTCISVDPTGRWLLTGSEDKTAVFWEVRNGRRAKVVQLPDEVTAVEWCPNPAITVAAISFGTSVWIVNPGLGSRKAVEDTDAMLSDPIDSEGRKSAIEWTRPSPADFQQYGLRFVLTMTREVTQVTWHKKGNYFASVCPTGVADSVAVHSLLRRHSAYHFKKGRDVQRVSFHPTKPLFFLATKTHVRVYNLQTNMLVKKLTSGSKWISSIAVHPQGDNVIIGTLDRRLCWFDLDLSTKPYKTLR
jgi:ribosome biogenesis protein ERB1